MELGELTFRMTPDCVGLHGANNMVAKATGYQGAHWVALGEMQHGFFDPRINLFLNGPDAAEKAARLAAAINQAMAPALQLAAE